MCAYWLYFFFSSRRRHTRLVSDWSSDVCSSDLLIMLVVGIAVLPFVPLETAAYEKAAQAWLGQPVKIGTVNLSLLPLPQLKFEKVVIGRDPQLKVAVIKARPELGSLWEDRVSL